jgi:DNA polymerase elongation subunit (family B)
MAQTKTTLSNEQIEQFLQGSDPEKYIVAVESEYHTNNVTLVINDPAKPKYQRVAHYEPFIWFKEDVTKIMYGGNRMKIIEARDKYGVTIKKLRTHNDEGYVPPRMENGYKFIAKCSQSYNRLISFFKDGGIDVFDKENYKMFILFSPTEQFLIQSGKRLFKGIDDYSDLHRFQFDLETEGLFASKHAITQIGVRDNRGMEHILESIGNTLSDKRDSERENIAKFFRIIDIIKPDIIAGYNSENFDWAYLFDRAERLGMDITELAITLNRISKIKRKSATLKLGSEIEHYNQTHMYGYNILDISHAVRRAMAINSEIKSWGLKYITQYSEIAKPNRVYVAGDKISLIWADKVNQYAFNNTNGDWYKITEKANLKPNYVITTGAYIVQRYLCDDLWETEQIDNLFNQASFLISKILPTTFMRSSTMGTAGQWKLIMSAWSYQNGLAIPETQQKREFTGGLSRLLEIGYAKDVAKLDYAALYPKIQLTWGIFPDLDISGVMRGILTYVVDTRDHFKNLTGSEKKKANKLSDELKNNRSNMTPSEISEVEAKIAEYKSLSNLYDKKQLPLKILANSWFGSYGAPYIFNWGDTDSAEETTCRGRQALRLMVRHFTEKHGFKPLVGDSVTFDTPIYLRNPNNNSIDIIPICELFNEDSKHLDVDKLRDYEDKKIEVLTRSGWKKLKYVYRHETNKKIHRVTTKDRLLNVTEDHSLFQNNIEVKPSELKRGDLIDTYEIPSNVDDRISISLDSAYLYGFFLGDGSASCSKRNVNYVSKKTGETKIYKSKRSDWKISNTRLDHLEKLASILENDFNVKPIIKNHLRSCSVYNLVVHDSTFTNLFCNQFYTSYREKRIPKFILNANLEVKKAFINGVFASDGYGDTIETCSDIGMKSQIAMAGISLLFKELNIEYKIKTRSDKQNFISFSLKNRNRDNSSFTDKTKKKSNEVWKNEIIPNNDKYSYVYDISTEDGTFVCGINGIIAHNTDGFNFAFPSNIDDIKYVARGSHWKTTKDAGKELIGLDAVLAEFNENYMEGRMGLDIDDICRSTINFARKNYANDINGKIKLVGNSIKSKKMPVFIEDFLAKAIRMLLDGDGQSFINYYYEYVDKIYNYQIPLVKMANKSRVKTTLSDYRKKASMKNKAGNPMPKQAHMELAILGGLNITLGDTLYYINTGNSKGQGDLKTIYHNRMTKKQLEKWYINNGQESTPPNVTKEVQLNCKLIDPAVVEHDFEIIKELELLKKALLAIDGDSDDDKVAIETRISEIETELHTDEYNVPKYLETFNNKVKPLLVCFNPEVRKNILLSIIKTKDKQTKIVTEKLKERTVYTKQECELVSGMPFNVGDQDSYADLMRMEDKEIKFWDKVDKLPNYMTQDEWDTIRSDYHNRMAKFRAESIEEEKNKLDYLFKRLEVKELSDVTNKGLLTIDIFIIADISTDGLGNLVSRKWGEVLAHVNDIFKYEEDAIRRDHYYNLTNNESVDRYDAWLDYTNQQLVMSGETINIDTDEITLVDATVVAKLLSEKANQGINTNKIKKVAEDDAEDDAENDAENDAEDDAVNDGINDGINDESIILEDEFDDTYAERPDGYEPIVTPTIEIVDDGWPF